MLRVGLTGGIGSGKSTVARRLAEHGAVLIDADVLAREVVSLGSEGLARIRERFGDRVIDDDGTLDRPALGRVVFEDEQARHDLNAIVHPRVLALTQQRMAEADADAIVVHDIPLLVELGRAPDYHLTVVVAAGEDIRLRRLMEDRGMTRNDAQARIDAQASDEQRRAAADVWLPNEEDLATLLASVDRLWSERLVPFEANLRSRTPVGRAPRAVPVDAASDRPATANRLLARIRTQVEAAGLADRVAGYEQIGLAAVSGLPAEDVIELRVTVDDLGVATTKAFEEALAMAGLLPSGAEQDVAHESPPAEPWREILFLGADPGRILRLHVRTPQVPGSGATPGHE